MGLFRDYLGFIGFRVGIQVCDKYLRWALESLNISYIGLSGFLG